MTFKTQLSELWRSNKSFVVFLVLMFTFRSVFADWNTVPTGSMIPTILEGDRILVNKMAYDIRVPFTHISLHKIADPQTGDIIVFDSEVSGKRMVKRVVAVPGDHVQMMNNRLTINGQALQYDPLRINVNANTLDKIEHLDDVDHMIRLNKAGSMLSSFKTVVVPEGHYLAMGDNRDNSADSRVIGFIPRDEIVGRSRSVVLSFNYENYYFPREDRFLIDLK